jgi:hypothetical protein
MNMAISSGNDEIPSFREKLTVFLNRNPDAKIEKQDDVYYVMNVWNADSISFIIEHQTQSELISALNNLIFPPRFTGIFHVDTNTMEYIYTLLDNNNPYLSRQFEFTIEGKTYHCGFNDASPRLLLLGKLFRPIGGIKGVGEDRNLMLLNMYTHPEILTTLGLENTFPSNVKPVSFFVNDFEGYDEEAIVEVSKYLNFFMRYYDRKTSYILIRPPLSNEREPMGQLQFIETEFPTRISTKRKDSFLIDLALAAQDTNARLAFLYYYQILEYAAFYYMDNDIQRKLLQILNSPDLAAFPNKYITKILDMISEIRQTDDAKLNKVVETCCDPSIVWKELQQNPSYFTKKIEFDGGFVIEAFISQDTTKESFSTMWIPKMPDTLRKIRNALVHSRESRLGLFIAPTRNNEIKIFPWLNLVRRIAEQTLIYK